MKRDFEMGKNIKKQENGQIFELFFFPGIFWRWVTWAKTHPLVPSVQSS
jgi:hypothetical protein